MSYKEILVDEQARQAIKRGVDIVADSVKMTIGPKGRNVIIDNGNEEPEVTNDGVSVAEAILVKDKFENVGVKKSKGVARKVNTLVGDSTSTAVVLHQAFLTQGMKNATAGLSVIGIRDGMLAATEDVRRELTLMSKKIKTDDELRQVAITSAESIETGTIIADTIKKVGQDGAVTVEESHTFGITSEVVDGLQFDKGYISNYMVTHKTKKEAEYKGVYVLVTNYKISAFMQIIPILEKVAATGKKDLVIIAEDLEGEALTACVLNKIQGAFNVLAVKAPGYGARKNDQLQDIATVLGATFISSETGAKLEEAELESLGMADKVISKKDSTTIIGGKGLPRVIKSRIAELKSQKKETTAKYDSENLDMRIGKLSNGVAVIRVGATTETDMLYLKKKIEDAVNATKSAIEEGIVIGGGIALVRAAQKVRAKMPTNLSNEFKTGYEIVLNGCDEPLRQIAVNADKGDGSIIVETVKKMTGNSGYDALIDDFVSDMFKEGIIDSVKAMRTALQIAAGDAAILLTVGRLMVEVQDESKIPNAIR